MMLGEGNGTPLQYSCLENPMDGGCHSGLPHRAKMHPCRQRVQCEAKFTSYFNQAFYSSPFVLFLRTL